MTWERVGLGVVPARATRTGNESSAIGTAWVAGPDLVHFFEVIFNDPGPRNA